MQPLERIIVWSRQQARYGYFVNPYDLITINDPDHEPIKPQEGVVGSVLVLHFADLDPYRFPQNGGVHPGYGLGDVVKWGRLLRDWVMSPEQAQQVARFCLTERQHATLAIHCHAGLSRSPSMAFAIADFLELDRRAIDWATQPPGTAAGRQAPNRHVYNLVARALRELAGETQ